MLLLNALKGVAAVPVLRGRGANILGGRGRSKEVEARLTEMPLPGCSY